MNILPSISYFKFVSANETSIGNQI